MYPKKLNAPFVLYVYSNVESGTLSENFTSFCKHFLPSFPWVHVFVLIARKQKTDVE